MIETFKVVGRLKASPDWSSLREEGVAGGYDRARSSHSGCSIMAVFIADSTVDGRADAMSLTDYGGQIDRWLGKRFGDGSNPARDRKLISQRSRRRR